jgi:hypothetical protein
LPRIFHKFFTKINNKTSVVLLMLKNLSCDRLSKNIIAIKMEDDQAIIRQFSMNLPVSLLLAFSRTSSQLVKSRQKSEWKNNIKIIQLAKIIYLEK